MANTTLIRDNHAIARHKNKLYNGITENKYDKRQITRTTQLHVQDLEQAHTQNLRKPDLSQVLRWRSTSHAYDKNKLGNGWHLLMSQSRKRDGIVITLIQITYFINKLNRLHLSGLFLRSVNR